MVLHYDDAEGKYSYDIEKFYNILCFINIIVINDKLTGLTTSILPSQGFELCPFRSYQSASQTSAIDSPQDGAVRQTRC